MIIVIRVIFQALTLIVIADALVSFVLPPYHSVRVFLDRIVDPMLAPIRRIVPAIGGMDFSPIVLIILLELIEFLILRLF